MRDAHARRAGAGSHLGGGAHRRARIAARRLLVDGDRRRQAVDAVQVGLLHLAQEHAGVAGEALDVAALALGVHRVERQARFAAARQARDDDELVARYRPSMFLRLCALDDDGVLAHRSCLHFPIGSARFAKIGSLARGAPRPAHDRPPSPPRAPPRTAPHDVRPGEDLSSHRRAMAKSATEKTYVRMVARWRGQGKRRAMATGAGRRKRDSHGRGTAPGAGRGARPTRADGPGGGLPSGARRSHACRSASSRGSHARASPGRCADRRRR